MCYQQYIVNELSVLSTIDSGWSSLLSAVDSGWSSVLSAVFIYSIFILDTLSIQSTGLPRGPDDNIQNKIEHR